MKRHWRSVWGRYLIAGFAIFLDELRHAMSPFDPRHRSLSESSQFSARLLMVVFFLTASLLFAIDASAQPQGLTPEQMKEFRGRVRAMRGAQPAVVQPAPNQGKKEDNKDKKKEEGKEETKEEGSGAETIKRPTDRPPEYDPNRTKLKPDKNGRVKFSYMGQPWTDVLQDYADAAGYTFDWLELPADFLNLTTQRSYTLDEARDLLNRHLLARGFTLVVKGELLTVLKVDQLDPSLLPRVEPDDLEDYLPYDFVRVQFSLPSSMDPAKTAEDVKVLLSPRATVRPLLASKRLLVIDAVANLRIARDMLYGEQMAAASVIQPRFYRIKYRRADLIADQVMIILGLDPASRNSPKSPNMDPKQMQMMMQMQQKGQDVSKILNAGAPKVFVTVDRQQNVILVNAPQDKFDEIERTIKILDVGPNGASEPEEMRTGGGRFTIERYKTVTASADAVIKALNELANLDPLTQLQSDSGSKTIFAYATAKDHAMIVKMIGKLDGSGRSVEVIWLPPHLPADQVAGSIAALIGGAEEEEEEDDYPWYYYSRRNDKKDDKQSEFRVFPDLENNRLLLWASEDELAEVQNLVDKLKQNPDGTYGDNRTVRSYRTQNPENMRELLEKLKQTWPGDNPIEIEIENSPEGEEESATKKDTSEADEDELTSRSPSKFHLAQVAKPSEDSEISEPSESKAPAPIKITMTSEGELIIASQDTKALDQLQNLLQSLIPSEPEYKVFKLLHVAASDVVFNLEDYFEDAMAEEGEEIRDWWGRRQETKPDPGPLTLGRRRPLRFIGDNYTNTVVVANASPSQLKTIKELIDQYDQYPEPQEYLQRKTEVIQVKYSRAADIATSLTDVYRDLLSSRDKEFQDSEGKTTTNSLYSRNYVFGDIQRELVNKDKPVVIRFEGVLSISVDNVSNSLIVCAREELMRSIVKTVRDLDEAAKPKTVVRTYEINGTIDAKTLRETIAKAMGQPWPGGKPLQPSAAKQPQAGQQDQNREERRERRRRRGD